jgi:uncharacterized membrane protein
MERIMSAVAGGKLLLSGLARRQLLRSAMGGYLAYRAISGFCGMYKAVRAKNPPRTLSHPLSREICVRESITVMRSPEEAFRVWRDLRNLPRFIRHVRHVEVLDAHRSRWQVAGPGNATVVWDALVTREIPNEHLAWVTVDGKHVQHRGEVDFTPAPGDRGTVVSVCLIYKHMAGAAGALIAKLFRREPVQEIRDELRRFKQYVETGEIAVNTGPSGRSGEAQRDKRTDAQKRALVEEASKESFPASDAPAWTGAGT